MARKNNNFCHLQGKADVPPPLPWVRLRPIDAHANGGVLKIVEIKRNKNVENKSGKRNFI